MATDVEAVCVTGIGIDIPGLGAPDALLEPRDAAAAWPRRPIPEAEPRGELRYKDGATRMALRAAERALQSAGLPTSSVDQVNSERLGVVVSSNLGNIDTVCRVAGTIRSTSTRHVRPMDLPNASSNVVASTVAMRFGCRALNLMVCNGAHSGIDALHLAGNAIRRGRATRILVVGVEPFNDVVAKLMGESSMAPSMPHGHALLGDGAAAIVVESDAAAATRNASVLGQLAGYGYDSGMNVSRSVQAARRSTVGAVDVWLTPALTYPETAASVERALERWSGERPRAIVDLTAALGEMYGALGVVQCLAACLWLRTHAGRVAIVTSGACWGDGSASLVVTTSADRQRHSQTAALATALEPR